MRSASLLKTSALILRFGLSLVKIDNSLVELLTNNFVYCIIIKTLLNKSDFSKYLIKHTTRSIPIRPIPIKAKQVYLYFHSSIIKPTTKNKS